MSLPLEPSMNHLLEIFSFYLEDTEAPKIVNFDNVRSRIAYGTSLDDLSEDEISCVTQVCKRFKDSPRYGEFFPNDDVADTLLQKYSA